MPSLGSEMESGTLVEWKIKPGDVVRRGDIVAAVETEKGIIDIESFEAGTIERLAVEPGMRVAVDTPLAWFVGAVAEAATAAVATAPVAAPAAPAPGPAAPRAAAGGGAPRRRISPAARAHAAQLGVDLDAVQGSGPAGTVTLQDVEAHARAGARVAAPAAPAPAAPSAAGRSAAMRQVIAAAMSRSKREIPHYYLQAALDFTPARDWLEAYNAARPVPERLLPAVLLIKAVARAAAEQPGFNGYYAEGRFQPSTAVHAGVAIAVRGGGLVAPAITEADRLTLAALMQALTGLVGRVRTGRMRSSEFGSATITVNSLGEEGIDLLYPIIQPPQVAIVGFGSVLERAWVVDGRVVPRAVMNVTLAADHRVTDGRDGARFLARVLRHLAAPAEL